jgi:hypothetical protein
MTDTTVTIEFDDGTKESGTLNFYSLYLLREGGDKARAIYESYQKIRLNGAKDELDYAYLVYTAYVCANLDKDYIDYPEFLKRLIPNRGCCCTLSTYSSTRSRKKKRLRQCLQKGDKASK